MTAQPAILQALFEIDTALARHGVPELSPYWRAQAIRFYEHPTAKIEVEEVGRGGGKNLYALKTSMAETNAGEYCIPIGERHAFVHVSENLNESGKDRRQAAQYYGLLNIEFDVNGDAICLRRKRRDYRILSNRIGSLSGFRCFGWTLNEAAKQSLDGVNPCSELAANLRAMSVTHEEARGRVISSPTVRVGYFNELCERGNTDDQIFGNAPSWVANPSITEEQTRQLEPDERVWRREYLAVAQGAALAGFDADQCHRALRALPQLGQQISPWVLGFDASAGRGDATVSLACCAFMPELDDRDLYEWDPCPDFPQAIEYRYTIYDTRIRKPNVSPPRPLILISDIQALEGKFAASLTSNQALEPAIQTCRRLRIRQAFGDQFGAFWLQSAFSARGVQYVSLPWTNASKIEGAIRLRQWLRDGTLVVEPTEQGQALIRDLLSVEEATTTSGALSIGVKRTSSGHGDRFAALLSLAIADSNGMLLGGSRIRAGQPVASPYNRRFAETLETEE